ncbi:MAG: orotidine-5'-phosphate decarboxylase [Lactobacillaceae bacterium]|jgi:orotidine-5'-phosphate decarboxylase|nr:orotidine-5'-phosphate decarboxylase [Lactobacillaceae bacterium]
MPKPVFIALDFATTTQAREFLAKFADVEKPAIKIGMELFYTADGFAFVQAAKAQGFTIFLDLKLYDIPNTVEKAAYNVGLLGVNYLTVHAAGGKRMLAGAVSGVTAGAKAAGVVVPQVLAVTQLTSFSEAELQATQQVSVSLRESVIHLAQLAAEAGVAGTISSAFESADIHAHTPAEFLSITPGIRFAGDAVGDQSRVVTPKRAAEMGANGIVVGRSITQAADPVAAYQQAVSELND